MDYTMLFSEIQEGRAPLYKRTSSLYEVCQRLVDGRRARGKRYNLAGLVVVLVLATLAGMQSLLGGSRMGSRSASPPVREIASVLETHAVCKYLQLCVSPPGQSTGECEAFSLVRPQRGGKPVRTGTEPFNGTAKLAFDGKALKGTGRQLMGERIRSRRTAAGV